MQRWVPFVSHFPEAHTAVNIKIQLEEMLAKLGLKDVPLRRVVVNDNAANAKKVT